MIFMHVQKCFVHILKHLFPAVTENGSASQHVSTGAGHEGDGSRNLDGGANGQIPILVGSSSHLAHMGKRMDMHTPLIGSKLVRPCSCMPMTAHMRTMVCV